MQNAKCKMQNAKCKMQNAKCKMQNAKFPLYSVIPAQAGTDDAERGQNQVTEPVEGREFCRAARKKTSEAKSISYYLVIAGLIFRQAQ
jgi:hypothetical protein